MQPTVLIFLEEAGLPRDTWNWGLESPVKGSVKRPNPGRVYWKKLLSGDQLC